MPQKIDPRLVHAHQSAVAWAQFCSGVLDFARQHGQEVLQEEYDRIWARVPPDPQAD